MLIDDKMAFISYIPAISSFSRWASSYNFFNWGDRGDNDGCGGNNDEVRDFSASDDDESVGDNDDDDDDCWSGDDKDDDDDDVGCNNVVALLVEEHNFNTSYGWCRYKCADAL